MSQLQNKIALVTGGSRGIGRAIVERFVKEQATVVACSRGERPVNLSAQVLWVQADVADPVKVLALRRTVEEKFGALHVLVNNAGIQIEKTVPHTTDEDWDVLMGVNAKGVFHCCRAFIPLLAQSGGGSIINIGSISGRVADSKMALYNASKAFVHGLTRSIAVDHGHQKIRCNAICPGWIMTDMAEAAFAPATNPDAAKRDALARHHLGRFGQPQDIAATAVWLASDESAFATGQTFVIDGGLTAASPINPTLF